MKIRIKIVLLLVILAWGGRAAGQSNPSGGTLAGTVSDASSGHPLVYVQVYIEALARGDVTDTRGHFEIGNIDPGRHRVSVSLLGYARHEFEAVIEAGRTTSAAVALQPKAFSFEEVQVTAGRHGVLEQNVSQLVNILSSAEIRQKNTTQTPELLQDEVGLFLQKTNHGGGSPIIRGFRANKLLLMVDGIRMNNATYRGGNLQYLNTIDSQAIDRIEVVHGPASALYGSDALGGALNVITREPQLAPDGTVSLTGSAGSRLASADASRVLHGDVAVSGPGFGLLFSASHRRYGDIRRGKVGGDLLMQRLRGDSRTDRTLRRTQAPNGYSGNAGLAKAVIRAGERGTIAAAVQLDRQEAVPRYDVYESQQYDLWHYDPQERDLSYVRYSHQDRGPIFDAAAVTVSHQRQMEARISRRTGATLTTRQQFETRTTGLQVQFDRILRARHFLVYGAEIYWDRVAAASSEQDGAGATTMADPLYPDASTHRSFGAFAQGEFHLTPLWLIHTGLRYSAFALRARFDRYPSAVSQLGDVKITPAALTASLGSVFRVTENLRIVSQIAQGFRAPNLDDLSKLGPGKGGNFYDVPNVDVKPERVLSIDGGIKYVSASARLTFLAYTSRITDLLLRRETEFLGLSYIVAGGDTLAVYHKENAGRAYTAGIETGVEVLLSDRLMFQGNLSWTYGHNSTYSEPLSAIPPVNGLLRVQWRRGGLAFALSSRFALEQHRLSSEDELDLRVPEGGAPGWITLNAGASYGINDRFRLRLDVANLLDLNYREYLSGINARGRDIVLAAEASF